MFASIVKIARYRGTVLVTGESGSGKELVTRAIHQLGPYAGGPLVSVNCSNLLDGLAESQLFGHVKGAFTHAREAHAGYFRQATGGTLFLDEAGELPLLLQAKLLRAVERLEVQPVGSSETFQVDLRLIAATNRDLRTMVEAGQFRADLYYRLDVVSIRIPPLRDRLEDIGALTAHFAQICNKESGKNVRFISAEALKSLRDYQWPGNVRELSHVIERAVLLSENDRIDTDNLPPEILDPVETEEVADGGAMAQQETMVVERNRALGSHTLEGVLKAAVERSLRAARGDCAEAARLLGISRPAIYRKMARFGISNATVRQSYGAPRMTNRLGN
jgi:DNA-binding NtrC family response regulator